MPTPAEHNPIESRLADLHPGPAGPVPDAFLSRVRTRRTRTIIARAAAGVAGLGLLALLTIRPSSPAPGLDPTPIARDPGPSDPAGVDTERATAAGASTLASFRRLYAKDESVDELLDVLPTVPGLAGDPDTYRLGDRDARWAQGL
ncbi:MAG: hypothetical protein ACF8LK_04170 [Phycisphaerales bacterium JB041]